MRSAGRSSDEHFGEAVGARARDVRPEGVERDVEDALVELLPVGGDLLHARFGVEVPEAYRAVVGAGEEEQPVGVEGEPGDGVEVGDHRVRAASRHGVPEADVAVLVRRHEQRARRVRAHARRGAVARHAQHRLSGLEVVQHERAIAVDDGGARGRVR